MAKTPKPLNLPRSPERQALIERNLPIAKYVTGRLLRSYGGALGADDLYSECLLALVFAADYFDFAKGFRFSTYATNVMYQRVSKMVDESAGLVHVPHNCVKDLRLLRGGGKIEMRQYHRDALTFFARKFLRWNPDENEQEPMVPANEVDERWWDVRDALALLDPADRQLLTERYGLGDSRQYTLEEIGRKRGGVTRERARQKCDEALAKLRDLLDAPAPAKRAYRVKTRREVG